ncbi:hypothetical protein NXU99_27950 [Parabacteroides goldsteinii]|nr:hypothetical protein [Parabacteroides goldsteinii]MCS2429334.1 hypothetical protein [Parabacteroides goldsteinii]
MNTPFVYGRIADKENFTDREQEVKLLTQNFNSLVNTVIISPRRWGKTSLFNKTAQLLLNSSKDYYICQSIFSIVGRRKNFILLMQMRC